MSGADGYGHVVIVQLTLQCPLECAHCVTESSPSRREEMSTEEAVGLVGDLAASGRVRRVVFSGGEPFSRVQRLRACVTAARENELSVSIVTSGSWARSPEAARSMMLSLGPALDGEIQVSVDRYRLSQIGFDPMRNALAAAEDAGWRPGLFVTKAKANDNIDALARAGIGADVFDRVDKRYMMAEFAGRMKAALQLSEDLAWGAFEDVPGDCCSAAAAPLIRTDRTVATCCGIPAEPGRAPLPLTIGNARTDPASSWLGRGAQSGFVAALRFMGPKLLLEQSYAAAGVPLPQDKFQTDSICNLCRFLTTDQPAAARAEAFVRSDAGRRMIAVMRALREPPQRESAGGV